MDAALWAIDEALSHDLPLRLLYAIDSGRTVDINSRPLAHAFATAEAAVRYASMPIDSARRPVKIEVEIV